MYDQPRRVNSLTRSSGRGPLGGGDRRARPLLAYSFDPNPGNLGAKAFVPSGLASKAALVVVLHGCTQTPEGYDQGTAWTNLAERHGFAVLFPEQLRANNPNACFNWFEPGDMRRGAGEPASIKAMIDRIVSDHDLDPARVFITGLSAGAAMTGVMLATYPEAFAGAGLIAGLPYGVASSMPAAFSRMRSRGRETDPQLAALVRAASAHDGPWPTISVWHGTADMTVHASNADATVAQWRAVHELADAQGTETTIDGHTHRVWRDASGDIGVEEYVIMGMGHGTPLDAQNPGNEERAGAYLLDVGLSSTQCLATSWGLTPGLQVAVNKHAAPSRERPIPMPAAAAETLTLNARTDVQQIIEDALRAAGLMR